MFFQLKKSLAASVAAHLGHADVSASDLEAEFSTPPSLAMGHLALPCFRIAKLLGKSANQVATELVAAVAKDGISGAVAGPYANFRFDVRALYETSAERCFFQRERYGSDDSGQGKRILFESCSPNLAKRLALPHLRSTLLGNTLANIYGFLGYETIRVNFVGDWGIQFARLIAAVQLWGRKDFLDMSQLSELYARFQKESEENPALGEKASAELKALESGSPETLRLWKEIREVSVASMERTLERLAVRFDHVEGESRHVSEIEGTLEAIRKNAGARLSEGAWIVDIEGLPTPALVQKRDGTTLYLTRDLAAAIDRWNRFQFDKSYYIVSEQQKLHFELLFGVLKKMGHHWALRCEHLSFGNVTQKAEKLSAREGRGGFLDEFLDEARRLALAECVARTPGLTDKDSVAEAVGRAAVVFAELSLPRSGDVELDWKEALAFDGETGPAVQYAAFRAAAILEKAEELPPGSAVLVPEGYVFAAEEEALVVELSKLRSTLHQCVRDNEPCHLTRYLIDLAKAFSRFYYRLPVLQATEPTHRQLRLHLVRATRQTLANGLDLLGIPCPKEM